MRVGLVVKALLDGSVSTDRTLLRLVIQGSKLPSGYPSPLLVRGAQRRLARRARTALVLGISFYRIAHEHPAVLAGSIIGLVYSAGSQLAHLITALQG